MKEIHEKVFDYLFTLHLESKKSETPFYFRMRQRFYESQDRFWFPGNEDFVAISFWMGNDRTNRSPDIYLEIRTDGQVILYLIARDNESKYRLFENLARTIPGMGTATDKGIWKKLYTEKHNNDYLSQLERFLKTDKPIIDRFLDSSLKTRSFEDFSPPTVMEEEEEYTSHFESSTRKIESDEFYEMLTRIFYVRNKTADYFFNSEDTSDLPEFSIKSLEVRNFRGIHQARIEGLPVDSKWIIITGENGFGKSSVLQSLAIGLFGPRDGSYNLLPDEGFVALEMLIRNQPFINLSFNSTNSKQWSIGKKLAVYGASRLNISKDNYRTDPDNVTYNLFYPDGSLINIETELKEAKAYNETKFNLLKNAFIKLIPDLHDIRIVTINNKPVVVYIEKDKNGNPYQEVTFENLASGFRNIIAIVGDFVSRFSEVQFDVNDLARLTGIVIIDEIELHLHPKYQKALPKILSEIFPRILFIASTHSPIPLLGVPKETALLRVNRSNETGITMERLDVDFKTLLPNAILTSPVFGFAEIIPEGRDAATLLDVSDSYGESVQKNMISHQISEFLSEEKTREFLQLLNNKKEDEEG